MGRLYMLVGLPGCGKSTYAKSVAQNHPNYVWVSSDNVRYTMINDQAHYFDHEYEVYKEFTNQIKMNLNNGFNVLADATHLTRNSRKKLLNALEIDANEVSVIWIDTSFETSCERNSKREGITRVPQQQMFKMRNRFQAPQFFEGFKDIYKLTADGRFVKLRKGS